MRAIATSAVLLVLASCGGRSKPVKIAASNVVIGDCVDPSSAGVLSSDPELRSADRDINGDSESETVFADRALCSRGNCYWNLFASHKGCERYIGTVAGASLEILEQQGDAGFYDLRGWWKLPGGKRQLVQNYRFREGGYQLFEVLICRQGGDDQLQCAAEEQAAD